MSHPPASRQKIDEFWRTLVESNDIVGKLEQQGVPREVLRDKAGSFAQMRQLITRGTYTADNGVAPIAEADLTIPTYGNLWRLPADHTLRIELTNLDSPYIAPSRVPSVTTVSNVAVEIPIR